MKRSRKFSIVLIVAMMLTIAGMVTAYASVAQAPVFLESSGRWIQSYTISANYSKWTYTTDDGSRAVSKLRKNRDFVVECTANGLTMYPTYYKVYVDIIHEPVTKELSITGVASDTAAYTTDEYDNFPLCLGVRTDPRSTSSYTSSGIWSPDMYE